ncbi:hypothetical protein ACCS93_38850 [Rhizobium ruizarguesonis]
MAEFYSAPTARLPLPWPAFAPPLAIGILMKRETCSASRLDKSFNPDWIGDEMHFKKVT